MNVCKKCGDRLAPHTTCLRCDSNFSSDAIRRCNRCGSQMGNSMGPCWTCAEIDKQRAIDEAILRPNREPPGVAEMSRMMRDMMDPPRHIKGQFNARTFYRGIAFLSLMSRGHPIDDDTVDMAIKLGDKLTSRSGDE